MAFAENCSDSRTVLVSNLLDVLFVWEWKNPTENKIGLSYKIDIQSKFLFWNDQKGNAYIYIYIYIYSRTRHQLSPVPMTESSQGRSFCKQFLCTCYVCTFIHYNKNTDIFKILHFKTSGIWLYLCCRYCQITSLALKSTQRCLGLRSAWLSAVQQSAPH